MVVDCVLLQEDSYEVVLSDGRHFISDISYEMGSFVGDLTVNYF